MRVRSFSLVFALLPIASAAPLAGCGLLVGVDWDRVAQTDAGNTVYLPDGAPAPPGYIPPGTDGGGDGGDGGGVGGDSAPPTCSPPKITCVQGCCDDDVDPGLPTAVTAGQSNTCAVTSTGKVRCWGSNVVGQLGRGSGPDSLVPKTAYGMPSGATQAIIGSAHGCAVVGNLVGCWGANGSGQVGFDGTPASLGLETPGRVQKITGSVITLAVGSNFSCATVDGTAYCWGDNADGQLATDPSTYRSSTPLTIAQLGSGVQSVGAGNNEACAVVAGGGVTCWGGSNNPPTPVAGITGASKIAVAPLFKCALAGGTVLCWGDNFYAELGNNSSDWVTPKPPTGLPTDVTQLAIGGTHGCALSSGEIWCWGNNPYGELGRDPVSVSKALPAKVPGVTGVIGIAAGDNHTCALLGNNTLKCWGSNGVGQLGNGTKDSGPTPVTVTWP